MWLFIYYIEILLKRQTLDVTFDTFIDETGSASRWINGNNEGLVSIPLCISNEIYNHVFFVEQVYVEELAASWSSISHIGHLAGRVGTQSEYSVGSWGTCVLYIRNKYFEW